MEINFAGLKLGENKGLSEIFNAFHGGVRQEGGFRIAGMPKMQIGLSASARCSWYDLSLKNKWAAM